MPTRFVKIKFSRSWLDSENDHDAERFSLIDCLRVADAFDPGSLGPRLVCQLIDAFAADALNDKSCIKSHGFEPW